MPSLTTIIIDAGELKVSYGTLFRLPAEILTPAQMKFYAAASLGWSQCPLGFSIFKFAGTLGSQVVIPGLILQGTKPKRKFPEYKLVFSKDQITAFATEIVEEEDRIERESISYVSDLTHDLRALSSEIYNAAESLKTSLTQAEYRAASFKSDTVIAAQQMLSLRLDMLDYTTGLALEQHPERIPVYKKVDKVVKCFRPNLASKDIRLDLSGPSEGFTFGPPVLELVPFVIMENAIKYSPTRGYIDIKVSDHAQRIDVHVRSLGPKIMRAEQERVFERGFRGMNARETGKSGSGIGLFAAKSLISLSFGGTISVVQPPTPIYMDNAEVWPTTFSFSVPRVH